MVETLELDSGVRSDSVPEMEDAVRALQQQVNALMAQNATLDGSSEAPARRMLVDKKGLGKPLVFSGREEHFYVSAKKVENYVELCRLQWSCRMRSQRHQLRSVCLKSKQGLLQILTDNSSLCCQPSRTVRASTL